MIEETQPKQSDRQRDAIFITVALDGRVTTNLLGLTDREEKEAERLHGCFAPALRKLRAAAARNR